MPFLLFGILLAGGLLMALSWWSKTDTVTAKRTLFWLSIGLAASVGLTLLAAGKGLFAILPLGYTAWSFIRGKGGALPGGGADRDAPPGASTTRLSRAEAYEILGLEENASDDDIRSAYRRLIAQNHPDKGGSQWLAARINAAKDTLLGP